MKKVLVGVALLVMLVFSNGTPGEAAAAEVRATWLWNPWDLISDETGTLAFLESKNVNKVYVQIDRDIPKAVYQSFIEKASAQGMAIYALDGAPSWVAKKGFTNQDQLMAWIKNYQAGASAAQKFSGIHLDVEPYLYSGWSTNQRATILAYQDLMKKANASATSLALPLEADLPFWFDEISYKNIHGSGILAEWMIANTSSVTLMAYRDAAPLIIDVVKNEVNFAAKYGKTIVVGVETAPTDEGDTISFYEEGEMYMNGQLAEVQANYANVPGYGGIAIHYVDSWKTMAP
ncbi:amidase [Planococcus shenhongbingii]|uniref:Amidase n=1 Tax=Planococcus shenhongbingii TaxID=3058398 RepID=A0ABT8NBZ3_9BACL|nr:amidase [Planococcus sp. N017]MDN7245398.1 amidase [Planococcus sp. N017]